MAAVELAKTMAIPREGDNERLKRVARYLHGHPDYLQWYPFQEDTDTVVNHVVGIQEGFCSWGIISSPRGVVFNHASH